MEHQINEGLLTARVACLIKRHIWVYEIASPLSQPGKFVWTRTTASGVFDNRAQERLNSMGEWMKFNSKSIYGCTQAPKEFAVPVNSLLTYNPATKKLYIHLMAYPLDALILPGYAGKINYTQFLHDNSEIKFTTQQSHEFSKLDEKSNDIVLDLPVQKPGTEIPVIELSLK